MKFLGTLFFGLLAGVSGTATPVEKVVNLLKDLKKNLVADQYNDKNSCDKYRCWAKNTLDGRAKQIDAARAALTMGQHTILKLKGKVATLTAEIKSIDSDIADHEQAMEDETTRRQEANAEFTATTDETKQALEALEKAIKVLFNGTSLLQSDAAATRMVLRDVVEHTTVRAAAFLSQQKLGLLQQGAMTGYAPQSMTIQGMLQDMYATMAKNVEAATTDEATQNREYEDAMAGHRSFLASARAEKAAKEKQRAESEEDLAAETQQYEETEEKMNADIAFFDEVKANGESKNDQCNTRTKLAEEELAGVDEALKILTSDEARQTFLNAHDREAAASFLEVRNHRFASSTRSATAARAAAYEAIKSVSSHSGSLRLAQLAVSVYSAKVGHFEKVITAIDKMVDDLKTEDQADIAKRDECKAHYTKYTSDDENLKWEIKKNTAKIAKLEAKTARLQQEKEAAIEEKARIIKVIDDMNDARREENALFKKKRDDDEAANKLLNQALKALQKYYKKNNLGEVLLEKQEPVFERSADKAPEANLRAADHRGEQTKGVTNLIRMIINDLQREIDEGKANEAAAVEAHAKAVKEANKAKDAEQKKIDDCKTEIAATNKAIGQEEGARRLNNERKTANDQWKKDITPDCDFILKNFESRAAKRQDEISALGNAKAFLAGKQDNAFVQTYTQKRKGLRGGPALEA